MSQACRPDLTGPARAGQSPPPPLSPTRTVASGRSCSPRRCGSPATSTSPRNASRTPTPCPGRGPAGVPRNPGAWLTTAARRRALDAFRRDRTLRGKLPLLIEPDAQSRPPPPPTPAAATYPGRPAPADLHLLPPGARQGGAGGIDPRLVCGLSTAEVAQAFLVTEPTMAARITRAKKKIAAARIPYRIPGPPSCPPASMPC